MGNLQPIDSIMFIDEHGQYKGNRIAGSNAALLIYKKDKQYINDFVSELWDKYFDDIQKIRENICKKKKKKSKLLCLSGSSLPNEAFIEIANTVLSMKWEVHFSYLLNNGDIESINALFNDFESLPSQLEENLPPNVRLNLDIYSYLRRLKDDLKTQFALINKYKLSTKFWIANIVALFMSIGRKFAAKDKIPLGDIFIDNKLGRMNHSSFNKLLNLVYSVAFVSNFSKNLNFTNFVFSALDENYNGIFNISEKDDNKVKGLQIADACVWAMSVGNFHKTTAEYLPVVYNYEGCLEFCKILEPNFIELRNNELAKYGYFPKTIGS